jgi:phosphate transport system permease protein
MQLAGMRKARAVDIGMAWWFKISGILTIVILAGIFMMLLINGVKMFADVSVTEFLFSKTWNPSSYDDPTFGVLSMVVSTLLVTLGAMLFSVPLGVLAAVWLSEIASNAVRETVKPLIEMLASIPSVVIGFIGIVVVGPLLVKVFQLNNGLNALNGSILLGIMALPTIISVSEDAVRSIPQYLKEGSYALGANRWITIVQVTVPAALPGILAAVVLGTGRAIGETMAVLMATGNAIQMPEGFFSSVRTMTATIAIELGEVPFGSTHYYAIFAVGALLFIMTLAVNLIAEWIIKKFRWTKK